MVKSHLVLSSAAFRQNPQSRSYLEFTIRKRRVGKAFVAAKRFLQRLILLRPTQMLNQLEKSSFYTTWFDP